jgi:serine/threonine protein kinase
VCVCVCVCMCVCMCVCVDISNHIYYFCQVLNGGRMGRQLDIWAVGCVVVEMFTNRFPFADQFSNDITLMRRIRDLKRCKFSKVLCIMTYIGTILGH